VAYNKAQTQEKLLFMKLLEELALVASTSEPAQKRVGRPSLCRKDMIFSMCLSIYSGKSARRANSELEIAKKLNMISHKPHHNSVLNYFSDAKLTPILKELIVRSSLPLKIVERDFTVDSSGFATSQFGEWRSAKWQTKERKQWVKAHVMSGVKTNIITSIEITRGHVADVVMFEPLVNQTGENFRMFEISADKAYLSRKNLELVNSYKAVPFIPFKKNNRGNASGSQVWARMFKYFWLKEAEFMEHYHKRSNAETVFAMMKRKFNSRVRSRNFVGQTNELLCMAICHNICVLIQEMFELGIGINFCVNDEVAQ